MSRRLLLLAVAVALLLVGAVPAAAAWLASGSGSTSSRAAALAAPSGLAVTDQSCTPTSSGATTVAYRGGTTALGTNTVTVNRPPATVAGDLLVAGYSIRSSDAVLTPPAGWTRVRLDVYAGRNISTGIWYRTASSADPPSWTWTASVTGANAVAALAAYSGATGVDAHGVSMQNGSAIVAPSITPSPAGTRLVGLFSLHALTDITPPPGMVRRLHLSTPDINGGGDHQMSIQLSDESWTPAGSATGTRTATTSTSKENIGQLLALTPSVPPTPSTVSYQGGTTGTGTTSLVLTAPAGVREGDLLLAGLGKRKVPPSGAGPPGWTSLGYVLYSWSDYLQAVYYRVATAADAAGTPYTWTFGGEDSKAAGALLLYRGVDQRNPVAASAGLANASGDTVTAPSVTPARPDTRLVGVFGGSDGRTVVTPAAGMTSRQSVTTGGGGSEVTVAVQDEGWPTATATGTRTVTLSGGARPVGHLVALKAESHPLAALSWTPTTSTYAEGYRLGRSVGGGETTATTLAPATLRSHTLGHTQRLTPGTTYGLSLRTSVQSWLSVDDTTTTFTAITTC